MTKDKEKKLRQAFEDTIWMAIRYAHGRHTYAPSLLRDAVELYQKVYPDWKPRKDLAIKQPNKDDVFYGLDSDYLNDLFE